MEKTALLSVSDCEQLARSLVETYLGIDNSEHFPEYESEVKSMTKVVIKSAKHAKMFEAKKAR